MQATTKSVAMREEALSRAVGGISMTNYPAIIEGFAAKGIAMDDIRPRENVFTYHAWLALGRQVRKGEHGVRCLTFVHYESKDKDAVGKPKRSGSRPWSTTVFHVSQTDAIGGAA